MNSDLPRERDAPTRPLPITERILRRLGRPRWLWILLWAMVPLISPFVFATAIRLSGDALTTPDFLNLLATQTVLAYACFVLLWGGGLMARQAAILQQDLARLETADPSTDLFDGIGSVRGPLVLTTIVVAISSANGWVTYGPAPPLAALPLLFVYMTPIMTFVWVYLTILSDFNRLGRKPLALDQFPEDRTLGLEQLGSLASTGLGLLLVAAVPVLLAGSDEPVTLGISLAIVAMTVAIFVLSMWRLHRQMAAAKARYVALARRLYADAYAPIRGEASVERLEAQASALRAAQSLDERANNLLTWPIDEGTLKFIAVVITGVVTSLVVRGLFAALGF
jgi:hypothetical protein